MWTSCVTSLRMCTKLPPCEARDMCLTATACFVVLRSNYCWIGKNIMTKCNSFIRIGYGSAVYKVWLWSESQFWLWKSPLIVLLYKKAWQTFWKMQNNYDVTNPDYMCIGKLLRCQTMLWHHSQSRTMLWSQTNIDLHVLRFCLPENSQKFELITFNSSLSFS